MRTARQPRKFKGETILRARQALQMSRARFARLVGCSSYSVYMWETDQTEPDTKSLTRLADTLNQTLDFFYE